MNFELQTLLDLNSMKAEGTTQEETTKALNVHTEAIQALLNVVQEQAEQIRELRHNLYSIAPALEIIEAMTEDPEEKQELIDRYMIHNYDWDYDSRNFQPDKIINEMAAAAKDPEAREVLQTLYEDYGAGEITDLYKHWKGMNTYSNIIHNLMIDTDTQKG